MTFKILVPKTISAEILGLSSCTQSRCEAGGLLLGFRKGDAIELTTITRPNRWDRATPFRFERSAFGHRIAALRAWKLSHGTVDWVGEWHTHPAGSPTPSYIDQTNWRKIARHTMRPMAFLIGGRTDLFVGLQDPSSRKVLRLDRIESDETFELFAML